jgi:hypothetical protein
LRPDASNVVAKFPEIKGRIESAALDPDGDLLVVVVGPTNRQYDVRVFDLITGSPKNVDGDSLRRNSATASLDTYLPRTRDSNLEALLGAEPWRNKPLRQIFARGPDGSTMVTGGAYRDRGYLLLWTNNPAWQLTLGLDYDLWYAPQFSPDSRRLALATSEGVVLVCELEEIINRINRMGLGWR